MSLPPPALEPWWETAPPGSEVAVALIKVDLAGATLEGPELPEEAALKRRARYTAGVEYIAAQFGAAQPLSWQGDAVTLFLGGVADEALPALAFQAARELWERARIELDLPARIAAHVARVRWSPETGAMAPEDLQRCDLLANASPVGSLALSEDLTLALPEEAQRALTLRPPASSTSALRSTCPSSPKAEPSLNEKEPGVNPKSSLRPRTEVAVVPAERHANHLLDLAEVRGVVELDRDQSSPSEIDAPRRRADAAPALPVPLARRHR